SITVVPVNDAPAATAQAVSLSENATAAITLSGSDLETSDPANLTYTIVAGPTNGVLSGTGGNRTYTPNAHYNGADSFTFTVTDSGDPENCSGGAPACSAALTSTAATVTITVNPVNDRPVADAKVVSTNQGTAASIVLSGTDLETSAANLTFTYTQPAHGVV